MRPTFRKHERLTGRDRVKLVATTGKTVKLFPFRLSGLVMPLETSAAAQVAFAVPKRHVKLAVDRNRVRRHMREAYRLHKHRWYGPLAEAGIPTAITLDPHGTTSISYAFGAIPVDRRWRSIASVVPTPTGLEVTDESGISARIPFDRPSLSA